MSKIDHLPIVRDKASSLDEDQISECLADPKFDGKYFRGLNQQSQEALRHFAHRRGLLSLEESSLLGIAIADPSYGEKIPQEIIGKIRARMHAGAGIIVDTPSLDPPEITFQDDTEETAINSSVSEKAWQLFEDQISTCDDWVFTSHVLYLILRKPNPYIDKIWQLSLLRGPQFAWRIACEIFESPWIPTKQKEDVWDDIKQQHDVAGSRNSYPDERHMFYSVCRAASDRMQSECIDLFGQNLGIEDVCRVYSSCTPATRTILLKKYCSNLDPQGSVYLYAGKFLELFAIKNLSTDEKEEIMGAAHTFLDSLEYDVMYASSGPFTQLAVLCEHWEAIEKLIKEVCNYQNYYLKLLLNERCPAALKRKIAVGIASITFDLALDLSDKNLLALTQIIQNLQPEEANSYAENIVRVLFRQQALDSNDNILHDLRRFTGQGNYDHRVKIIDFLLGLIDFITDDDVRKKVGQLIISFRPRNDVLQSLQGKIPALQDEITANMNSIEEGVMGLLDTGEN